MFGYSSANSSRNPSKHGYSMHGGNEQQPQPLTYSQVPGSPTFRQAAVNAVAVVPLLCQDGDNWSVSSFEHLWQALKTHLGNTNDSDEPLLLVVPNASLTRPSDWRYTDTPLPSFHWQHGCQRLSLFDGRVGHSRQAHDRLLTKDWNDLIPSRRTAAVIGVLNVHDCQDADDIARALEELSTWAQRLSTPPYAATAQGRNLERDMPVERLFVFDSFDPNVPSVDLTSRGSSILAFPPTDDEHTEMMEMHLNVVINDLTVAIFKSLEAKIKESDALIQHRSVSASGFSSRENSGNVSARRGFQRMLSNTTTNSSGGLPNPEEPQLQTGKELNLSRINNLVGSESQLPDDNDADTNSDDNDDDEASVASTEDTTTASTRDVSTHSSTQSIAKPNILQQPLLTPLDGDWDSLDLHERDAQALRKREIGRREKYAADLSLLAGSPLDAYQRYIKAAELAKSGTPDPLWYAAAMEGCAASHISMAEGGGYSVDEYLDNNFGLPDEVMDLAKLPDEEQSTSGGTTTTTSSSKRLNSKKQTLPEVIIALCEEAQGIISRHEMLSPLYAELLLKLAHYSSELAEGHLRCRWGEGPGCYAGDPAGVPRWRKTSVANLVFNELKSGDVDMVSMNTFNRTKHVCNVLQQAVSIQGLDPGTRADVSVRAIQMCLKGIKASQWKRSDNKRRIVLPRKAAYFASVCAEAISCSSSGQAEYSTTSEDLWMLADHLYTSQTNDGSNWEGKYTWATVKASVLHALATLRPTTNTLEAAERLLSLLLEVQVLDDNATDEAKPKQVAKVGKVYEPYPHNEEMDRMSQMTSAQTTSFASKLRESLTTITAGSSLLVVEAKWADDQQIPPKLVPFGVQNPMAVTENLPSVWNAIPSRVCTTAQNRCLERVTRLRKSIPATSLSKSTSIGSSTSSDLPIFISSETNIVSDPTLDLQYVKKKVQSAYVDNNMKTFYNPYEKKNATADITRIACDEERSLSVKFGNKLSLPLDVQHCEIKFAPSEYRSVETTAVSFTIPPKATAFTVTIPFTIATHRDSKGEFVKQVHHVLGYSLTCVGRRHFIPLKSDNSNAVKSDHSIIPDAAWNYSYLQRPVNDSVDTALPQFEAYPSQPRLKILFADTGVAVGAESVVDLTFSEGELVSTPTFKLDNYSGASDTGKVEQLQIYSIGTSSSDRLLFDSSNVEDLSQDVNEDEETIFKQLWAKNKSSLLQVRILPTSLSMDALNDTSNNSSVVQFQYTAAKNTKNKATDKIVSYLRFKYRGSSTADADVWRKIDVKVRIRHTRGPYITSITFRPDLSPKCYYSELSRVLGHRAPLISSKSNKDKKPANEVLSAHVGVESGIYVASEAVTAILTIKNDTRSSIVISRPKDTSMGFVVSGLDKVSVKSETSVRVPLSVLRIPRTSDESSLDNFYKQFSDKLSLRWTSEDNTSKGHICITEAGVKSTMKHNRAMVSEICEAPCKVSVSVNGTDIDDELRVALGQPVMVNAKATLMDWIPQNIRNNGTLAIDLFCTAVTREESSIVPPTTSYDHIWCGKLREKVDIEDAVQLKHQAKIIFVKTGKYAISACARIMHQQDEGDNEEIWWAPKAQVVQIDQSLAT